MTTLKLTVVGRPAPQGSKRHVGRGVMIEASKYLPAWRKAVTVAAVQAIRDTGWQCTDSPAAVTVTVFLERPKSVKIVDRPHPIKPPDADKCARAVLDSLTDAGVWQDDAQVIQLTVAKVYADRRPTGCDIEVLTL